MMRLIDQPAGTGDLYEDGEFWGRHSLNVYQQDGEGRDEDAVGVQHIEGRVTPGRSISTFSGAACVLRVKARGQRDLITVVDPSGPSSSWSKSVVAAIA